MKIQRYKHELDVSYALGATLTFEMIKCHPEWVTRIFLSTSTENSDGLERLIELCRRNNIRVEMNDKAFNILSPKGNCFVIGEFRKSAHTLSDASHVVLVNPSTQET